MTHSEAQGRRAQATGEWAVKTPSFSAWVLRPAWEKGLWICRCWGHGAVPEWRSLLLCKLARDSGVQWRGARIQPAARYGVEVWNSLQVSSPAY